MCFEPMRVQKIDGSCSGGDILHIHGTNAPLRFTFGNLLLIGNQHATESGKPPHVESTRTKSKVEIERTSCSETRCTIDSNSSEQKPKWNVEQTISTNVFLKTHMDLFVRHLFFVYTFQYVLLLLVVYVTGTDAVCHVVILIPFWILTFIMHGVIVHNAIPAAVALSIGICLVQSSGCISQTRINTQIALKEQNRLYNGFITSNVDNSGEFYIEDVIYMVVFFVSYLAFYVRCFYEVRSFYSSGEFSVRCLYWLLLYVVVLAILNFVVSLVSFGNFAYTFLVVFIVYLGTIPSTLPLLYHANHSQVLVKCFE